MAGPEVQLRCLIEEATCSFCLGYFTEPVSVQCGHTFCTPCITRYWKGLKGGQQGTYPCPQCGQTAPTNTLRPNWQLANIVQILVKGPLKVGPHRVEGILSTDQEPAMFCGAGRPPTCPESVCFQVLARIPIQEAVQLLKAKMQNYLNDAKKDLENITELRTKEETKVTEVEENFNIRRDQLTSAFNKVQQFLETERCYHLNNLEESKKLKLQEILENVSKLNSQQASARDLITVTEVQCQQPEEELVKLLNDVRSILSRFEKVKCQCPDKAIKKESKEQAQQKEVAVEEEEEEEEEDEDEEMEEEEQEEVEEEEEDVEEKEEEEEEEQEGEEELMRKIIDSLEWRWARSYAGEVTLDPDTAHRVLDLSEDRRSVSIGETAQDLPDTPERFDSVIGVLGRERLSSGKHYWEVEVVGSEWDLGVCDESVSRKGKITFTPKDGYWIVWQRNREDTPHTSSMPFLGPPAPTMVVGLFLDYEEGRLSVYNVPDRSLIYTFSSVSFPRTLRPIFCPAAKGGRMDISTLNVLQ